MNSSKNNSGGVESFNIFLPVGTEFRLSEIVTLRGGFEPSYKILDQDSLQTVSSSSMSSRTEFVSKGLSLTSNLGLGVHYDDFGELNILFSNLLNDMSTWSFSYRYFFE